MQSIVHYGASADWWSFGVLMYESLCGYTPFGDDSTIQVYSKIFDFKVGASEFVLVPL